MLNIKARASRLKDPKHSPYASIKYKDSIEPQKLLEKNSLEIPKQPIGIFKTVLATVAGLGWSKFYMHPQNPIILIIKEF